jgi:hypothetical protein
MLDLRTETEPSGYNDAHAILLSTIEKLTPLSNVLVSHLIFNWILLGDVSFMKTVSKKGMYQIL